MANQALAKAEQSFQENPNSYQTRDLAYIAERKSQMAEATASIAVEQQKQTEANDNYHKEQGRIITGTKHGFRRAREAPSTSDQRSELMAKQLLAEQEARESADRRTADVLAALAKPVAVKEELRGMVITLLGSVLFESGQATFLPDARSRLDQLIDVLLITRERNLTIEGHTDSQGTDFYNIDLSQRRADEVRNYFIERKYQADRVEAHGLGEGHPIADNASAEGRANNSRIEIIIKRESLTSNK